MAHRYIFIAFLVLVMGCREKAVRSPECAQLLDRLDQAEREFFSASPDSAHEQRFYARAMIGLSASDSFAVASCDPNGRAFALLVQSNAALAAGKYERVLDGMPALAERINGLRKRELRDDYRARAARHEGSALLRSGQIDASIIVYEGIDAGALPLVERIHLSIYSAEAYFERRADGDTARVVVAWEEALESLRAFQPADSLQNIYRNNLFSRVYLNLSRIYETGSAHAFPVVERAETAGAGFWPPIRFHAIEVGVDVDSFGFGIPFGAFLVVVVLAIRWWWYEGRKA